MQRGHDLAGIGDLRRRAHAAVGHEELVDLRLRRLVQVLAPDDRVGRDQRRFPDDLEVLERRRVGLLDAPQVLGVVGGGVDLLVGDRHGVRFMVGVAHCLEAGLRVDVVGGEDIGRRH